MTTVPMKCFRDEDLCADRQPEFTRIDCTISFMSKQEVRDLFKNMIRIVFKNAKDVDLPAFPVMRCFSLANAKAVLQLPRYVQG